MQFISGHWRHKNKNIQYVLIICKQIEPAMVIKEIFHGSSKLASLYMQKKITHLIWIILPHIQKLCHLKIQLLMPYAMSSLFAKLGISNVGRTDNGPSEYRVFATYCNCLHFCLDTVYPVFNEELKMVLSSFNVPVRGWLMFRFKFLPVLSILLKIQISFGHYWTDPRKQGLTSA